MITINEDSFDVKYDRYLYDGDSHWYLMNNELEKFCLSAPSVIPDYFLTKDRTQIDIRQACGKVRKGDGLEHADLSFYLNDGQILNLMPTGRILTSSGKVC